MKYKKIDPNAPPASGVEKLKKTRIKRGLLTAGVFMLALRCEKFLRGENMLGRLVETVGSNTMSVYYLHWIFAATVFERLHVADGLLFNLLKAAALTALCTLISILFKKLPVLRKLVH